jgi:hypothetical protein
MDSDVMGTSGLASCTTTDLPDATIHYIIAASARKGFF